jgi:hypothetical protein
MTLSFRLSIMTGNLLRYLSFPLSTVPRAPAVTVPEGENGDALPPPLGPAPVVALDPQPLLAPEGVEFDFAQDLDPAVVFEPNLPPPEPDPVQQQQQAVTRSGRFV